jgi:hypothetical protein
MAATGTDDENPEAASARTHPDARRSRIRAILAEHDRELDTLAAAGGADAPVAALRASFLRLTAELNLGPEPETRTCPTCGALAMRAATRCMECWARLREPT